MNKLFTLLLSFVTIIATAQTPITATSKLTTANVYYGYGAELSHNVKLNLPAGQQEITINNISNTLDEKTLQISCPESVVLLSYRFNTQTDEVKPVENPVIKKMQDSIKMLTRQIATFTQQGAVAEEQLAKTSKLVEAFGTMPPANGGTKNIQNTAELIKLIDYYNGKIETFRNAIYALQTKRQDAQDRIAELTTQMEELQEKIVPAIAKTHGQLILQVLAKAAIPASFDITYYTPTAGWIPAYDMRVKSIDNTFKLMYKASVTQNTGIDWKQAKLTLSTSNPNLGTTLPLLSQWVLQYYVPAVYNEMARRKEAAYRSITANTSVMNNYQVEEKADMAGSDEVSEPSTVSSYLNLNESQLYVTYDIDLPYDIPSDGKSYSVVIKEESVKATYKHYAAPKLDKDAFLMAALNDWEQLNLLPGEANIIMDNVFLGKSFIDPNTTTDTLSISLGRDKRIGVKRTLMKEFSKTKILNDKKVETFTYEIVVKNNKKETVTLMLKDQYPLSQTKEIEVNLKDDHGGEVNDEIGTISWKLKLAPGESRKVRFTYSVTYPKDKKLSNLR